MWLCKKTHIPESNYEELILSFDLKEIAFIVNAVAVLLCLSHVSLLASYNKNILKQTPL